MSYFIIFKSGNAYFSKLMILKIIFKEYLNISSFAETAISSSRWQCWTIHSLAPLHFLQKCEEFCSQDLKTKMLYECF